MRKSVLDKISNKISPVLRKLNDHNIGFFGTETSVLRISKYAERSFAERPENVFGDSQKKYIAESIGSVIVKYPFTADIDLFTKRDNLSTVNSSNTYSFDLQTILPIEMIVQFSGSPNTEPVDLVEGDIIVDVFWDENNNPIPIVMELTRGHGNFYAKNLTSRKYDLTLVRSRLSDILESRIKQYIDDKVTERLNQ